MPGFNFDKVCIRHCCGCTLITFHETWNLHQLWNTDVLEAYALTRPYFIRSPDRQASVVESILEIKLTPAIFTFKDGAGSCAELHNETSTPGTPPDDWIASTISLAVSMLEPLIKVDFHV